MRSSRSPASVRAACRSTTRSGRDLKQMSSDRPLIRVLTWCVHAHKWSFLMALNLHARPDPDRDGRTLSRPQGRNRRMGVNMQMKHLGHDWRNTIWKIVSNPAFEVVAAIAVVMLATWIVVTIEVEEKKTLFPVPYDARR